MADRWYNADFVLYLGIGLGVGAALLGLGIGMGYSSSDKKQTPPLLQEADINGNSISDKFYAIGGKIAVIELDGKPLIQNLEKKILEKD